MLEALAALFFLVLNALFVLAEFAIVRARATKFEELSQKGNRAAKTSLEIVSNINSYLASIQLGITIASIGLGWIAQPFISKILNNLISNIPVEIISIYSYSISIAIAFIIVTFMHIIIGEQVPKYIAISLAEKMTMIFAFPIKIFYDLTYYPMLFINRTSEMIVKLIGIKKSKDDITHSEDEIRLILSQSEELGRISLQRLMMFEHLFDFGKTFVKEIMIPKDKIVTIDINCGYNDFIQTLSNYKFSRYPVKEGEDIVGFIHIKDIFMNCSVEEADKMEIKKFIREIKVINENLPVEKALRYFQENNIHISLVCDEQNKISGLLSVEDIIEDITGEIRDEFEKRPVYRLDLIFDKKSSIMDIKSDERFSALNEIIDKIFENKVLLTKNEVKEKIIKREKSFSTAIGHQVAIPHARIEGLKKPLIVVGKKDEGINFPSPDNRPVKLIFMILTPYNDPSIQLNILSKISKLISNLTLRKKLLSARNAEKIEEVFTIFEDNIPLD